MEEKLKQIINHYGVNNQQRKFAEEVFELQEAITKYENIVYKEYADTENVAEEIADCMVLLKQFQLHYKVSDTEVKRLINFKIDRQIKRLINFQIDRQIKRMGE